MTRYSRVLRIRDICRSNLLSFTRRAFNLLPPLSDPAILDIGCGSGVAAIELAQLSGGLIEAIDIDAAALDEFRRRAAEYNLGHRIKISQISMSEAEFPTESFDLIWSEGSIAVIGFQTGLENWRGYLKQNGCLVVHDSICDLLTKEKLIEDCGYIKLGQFIIPHEIWWSEYFGPLQKHLDALGEIESLSADEISDLGAARREIEGFDYSDDNYASVFFVLQNN